MDVVFTLFLAALLITNRVFISFFATLLRAFRGYTVQSFEFSY